MKEGLFNKINSLPSRDKKCFFSRLYDILNDRYSSFKYGIGKKEYANPPKEKIEAVEEKLYDEMFKPPLIPNPLIKFESYALN